MEKLTDRQLKLLLHLRTLKQGEPTEIKNNPNMDDDFKKLKEKGFVCNVIDNSVGTYKSYRFNISDKGTDLIDSLLMNN